MGVQGRSYPDETVRRVVWLLSSTDMTIAEISARMSCSASTVKTINKKFQVRDYAGFRSHWRQGFEPIEEIEKSA
jgi:DNA-binding MurR/RpiR family transcriptional regulator